MWSGPSKFEIRLDNGRTFSPGDIIAGRVIIELNRPEKIKGLILSVEGKAEVNWKETIGRKTTYYKGEEGYIKKSMYILGRTEIKTGLYVFPFYFRLPFNIPSSLEFRYGSVKYTVKAVVDRPWWFDYRAVKDFIIVTPYDLSECPMPMTPIDDEEDKTFCCFPCLNMGGMRVHVLLPTSGFTIGESALAKIGINNTSNVNVKKVKLQLLQVVKAHGHFPKLETKTETNTVQEAEVKRPFSKNDEVIIEMKVPALPYSNMVYCGLIDIEYSLRVVISFSGCHCSKKIKYPIVIGTRTASSEPSAPNPIIISMPMPSTAFFPGGEFSTNATHENEASASGSANPSLSTEKPPPTYNDATKGNN